MNPLSAALLGLLQGLTEFLPVSSSGHLALAQIVLPGFQQPGVLFDASLHVGTALAVLWFEREEIARWIRSRRGGRILALLVVGTGATAVVAVPLRRFAQDAFHRPLLVGVCLIATGCVVAATKFFGSGRVDESATRFRHAALMGLMQGVAIFPGLSRSGLTIAAGMGGGLERAWAARLSFLLGVPAILGVAAVELAGNRGAVVAMSPTVWMSYAVGMVVAAVSGYFALVIVLRTVSTELFHRFAWYCIPVGLLVVLSSVRVG
jgi:undecaprenyl-diphosphatase